MKIAWLLVLCLIVCAGCETVKGFGKDVRSVGKHIVRGSEDAKEKMEDVMP